MVRLFVISNLTKSERLSAKTSSHPANIRAIAHFLGGLDRGPTGRLLESFRQATKQGVVFPWNAKTVLNSTEYKH
jgi:hypothetical protein